MTDLTETTEIGKDSNAKNFVDFAAKQAAEVAGTVNARVSSVADVVSANAKTLNNYILSQVNSHPYIALGGAILCGWLSARICNFKK